MQNAAPGYCWIHPPGHVLHVVSECEMAFWYCPGVQLSQTMSSVVEHGDVLFLPWPHVVHSSHVSMVEPSSKVSPATQEIHEVSPEFGWTHPAGHGGQKLKNE